MGYPKVSKFAFCPSSIVFVGGCVTIDVLVCLVDVLVVYSDF